MIRPAVLLLALALQAGCATSALWKATDPDASIRISANDVSEAELHDQGLDYRIDQSGDYRVRKTGLQRFGDHALRAVFIPATVCLDTASVGAIVFAPLALDYWAVKSGGRTYGDMVEQSRTLETHGD